MERDITEFLCSWKERSSRKPLLVTGVRQCGKTYIIKKFGECYFENMAYLNFEENPSLSSIFEYDYDVNRIIDEIESVVLGYKIIAGKTLLIMDEIQECPKAITSLKYFCENKSDLHIICAGSLLGVAIKKNSIAFPVGKIERVQMYPLSFSEFLRADGEKNYYQGLLKKNLTCELPELYTKPLNKALINYYIIGGMPEAVNSWIINHDYEEVEQIQNNILEDYSSDFSKHAPLKEVPKLGWIWDSIPKQLAKENNKFMFSHVKSGKRAHELEDALEWLVDAGLIYCPQKVSVPSMPLSFEADATYFKVYLCDVGLLKRKAGLTYHSLLNQDNLSSGFRGALAENYVNNELINLGLHPYFYRSGNTAEIDFMVEYQENVIPIEVKSADNTRAKSLQQYIKKYQPKIAIKTSLKNVAMNEMDNCKLYSLPLYLLWRLQSIYD